MINVKRILAGMTLAGAAITAQATGSTTPPDGTTTPQCGANGCGTPVNATADANASVNFKGRGFSAVLGLGGASATPGALPSIDECQDAHSESKSFLGLYAYGESDVKNKADCVAARNARQQAQFNCDAAVRTMQSTGADQAKSVLAAEFLARNCTNAGVALTAAKNAYTNCKGSDTEDATVNAIGVCVKTPKKVETAAPVAAAAMPAQTPCDKSWKDLFTNAKTRSYCTGTVKQVGAGPNACGRAVCVDASGKEIPWTKAYMIDRRKANLKLGQ